MSYEHGNHEGVFLLLRFKTHKLKICKRQYASVSNYEDMKMKMKMRCSFFFFDLRLISLRYASVNMQDSSSGHLLRMWAIFISLMYLQIKTLVSCCTTDIIFYSFNTQKKPCNFFLTKHIDYLNMQATQRYPYNLKKVLHSL